MFNFVLTIFLMSVFMNNAVAQSSNLIPRQVLFGNPDKASVELSPDGEYISYLAPKDNVLNIFIAKRNDHANANPITNDKLRGIRFYGWSYSGEYILYLKDAGGDENWQLHKINISTLEDINLTPDEGVRTEIYKVSRKIPDKIIIGTNKRDKSYFDLYELNIKTNETKLLFENNEYKSFILDDEYNLRFLMKSAEDGGADIFSFDNGKKNLFLNIPPADVTGTYIAGFNKENKKIYFCDSIHSDTSRLFEWDLESNIRKEIYHNSKADIDSILVHPVEKTIEAVGTNYARSKWHIIDEKIKKDFAYLESVEKGEVSIASRTLDDKYWIITYMLDDAPFTYYFYDRKAQKAYKLFTNRKELEKYQLAKMEDVVIKSRDGLDLVSYLTRPLNSTGKPSLVLLVHGGPSVRDNWGLNTTHQWLANRGYSVLSVNYRGSTGFGKNFFKAGNGQWALKMHDDLIDAVNWAITNKIADKDKICIMGGSYGGYATLVGLTFTPDVFACGVDIVGPSNLVTLLNSVPPYWKSGLKFLINLTGGDPSTEEGRKILLEKSPLTYAEKIKRPLLIGQGANDPRVKRAESDQIVDKLKSKNIPVTYVLYPDEGHGFARPENSISFKAITEGFLAKYLGGEFEEIKDDFKNSSIEILTGREYISDFQKAK